MILKSIVVLSIGFSSFYIGNMFKVVSIESKPISTVQSMDMMEEENKITDKVKNA